MKVNFKKLKILLIIFLFFSFNFVFARNLEVRYPEIFGLKPETIEQGLEVYGKYLFNFSIFIVGVVLFASLVHGGILYLISTGDVAKLKDAREKITSAFFGIILLLSSYLILTTINPQLAVFKLPRLGKISPPKAEIKKGEPEKPTQIFYELPLGQVYEKGLWEKNRTQNLIDLVQNFEGFLTTRFTLSSNSFEKISDLYKYLSSLTEDCHCEELEAVVLKPANGGKPIGCLGDPCKEVREKINEALRKSKEISAKLEEYKESFKRMKDTLEEEGRKFRNLKEILENCKKRELLTRGEYYEAVSSIEELGGETKLVKSYLPAERDDPLVFYCSRGGTIFDLPYKIPEISPGELEKAKETSPTGVVERFKPLSCPGYVPLGTLIDNELTETSVAVNDGLNIVIYYIEKILEEISKMNEAVSQCNESRCQVSSACIPNPCYEPACGDPPFRTTPCLIGKCLPFTPFGPNPCFPFCNAMCVQAVGQCHGEPCPREKLKEIPQRIKMWEDEIFRFLDQIKMNVGEAKNIVEGKENEGEGKEKINLPVIKNVVQKCLNLGGKFLKNPQTETFWGLLRCDLALGNIGPDGKPIENCHPQDFFCCTTKSLEEAKREFPEAQAIEKEAEVIFTPLPTTTSTPSLICEGSFPYFSQYDERWKHQPYTRECGTTIADAGCGPTSMAMVLNYFKIATDPSKEIDWATKKNYRVCGSGTAHAFCCERAKEIGLNCKELYDIDSILDEVKNGKVAIVSGHGPPPYTKGGHYLVLTKVGREWDEKLVYFNDSKGPKRAPPCGRVPADFFERYGINFGCVIWK